MVLLLLLFPLYFYNVLINWLLCLFKLIWIMCVCSTEPNIMDRRKELNCPHWGWHHRSGLRETGLWLVGFCFSLWRIWVCSSQSNHLWIERRNLAPSSFPFSLTHRADGTIKLIQKNGLRYNIIVCVVHVNKPITFVWVCARASSCACCFCNILRAQMVCC